MEEITIGLDGGNAEIKAFESPANHFHTMHALRLVPSTEILEYEIRGELDKRPDLYCVDGTWYQLGEDAARRGAIVRFGEARYVKDYYGVIAAAVSARLTTTNKAQVTLIASRTPKDITYREDIRSSVMGKWTVRSKGVQKVITFVDVHDIDEPVAAFRSATLSDDLRIQSGWYLSGRVACLDTGGLTTAIAIANTGRFEYGDNRSGSFDLGMLDLERQLGEAIRTKYKAKLKGVNWLEANLIRKAFVNPQKGYNGRGVGMLPCVEERDAILEPFLAQLDNIFYRMGGVAGYDYILLAGGGAQVLGSIYKQRLQHPHISFVSSDIESDMFRMACARGAKLAYQILHKRGKI